MHWILVPSRLYAMDILMSAKLDVPVIVAAIAAVVLITEHKQHLSADVPMRALRSVIAETAAPCPDKDNVPYTADCIAFLTGPLWTPNPSSKPH
jgi:hypothetical protein